MSEINAGYLREMLAAKGQAEKAQDFGEPWSIRDRSDRTLPMSPAAEALGSAWNWVLYVSGHEFAAFLSRQKAERAIASVNACAGADSPQPGELVRLRAQRDALNDAYRPLAACLSPGDGPGRVHQALHELQERAAKAETALTALRTRLQGLASDMMERGLTPGHDYLPPGYVAGRLLAILAEAKAPEPSQSERQLAQALLVLKSCRFVGYPACGNIVSYDTTISDKRVIAALEALRKDGKLA